MGWVRGGATLAFVFGCSSTAIQSSEGPANGVDGVDATFAEADGDVVTLPDGAPREGGGPRGEAGASDGATPGIADSGTRDAPRDAPRESGGREAGSNDAAVAPSSGCGVVQPTGYFCHTRTFAGASRKYCVSVPGTYDENIPTRILFNLHGANSGPRSTPFTDQEANGGNKFLFVYPGSLGMYWDTSATGPDVTFLESVRAELESTYCVDSSRTFAEGTSSGGFMASSLACQRKVGVRASATAAGAVSCALATPIWMYHGQADTVVDYNVYGPPVRDAYVAANGCDSTTQPVSGSTPQCVEYDGCSERTVWCTRLTGGHRWEVSAWMNVGTLKFFESYFTR